MSEQHSIDEAIAHLGAALAQSIASDDRIIMGHVRDAHTLLKPLHSAHSSGRLPEPKSDLTDAEIYRLQIEMGVFGPGIAFARAVIAKANAS